MSEIKLDPEALEAAAQAGREAIRPYQRLAPGPDAAQSALEWREMQEVHQRPFRMIARAAVERYLDHLASKGVRPMPENQFERLALAVVLLREFVDKVQGNEALVEELRQKLTYGADYFDAHKDTFYEG